MSPLLMTAAIRRYPRWWVEVLLRVRMSILIGQTRQHRLESTPPGEVVARAMDADRYVLYADRWVDFLNGLAVVALGNESSSVLPAEVTIELGPRQQTLSLEPTRSN